MPKRHMPAGLIRRAEAALLAAGTLWAVSVTAGSDTASAAAAALWEALPLRVLRWELGDLWTRDGLSPAAALTLGEAPLLLAARPAVAELWSAREEAPAQEPEETVTVPVEETPLEAPAAADNGVTAKTLIPTDPSGYTVVGRTYISNSTDHALSVSDLEAPFAAELAADVPQLLILHTHGSEAYTPAGEPEVVWSGDHRTTDSRYNVVQVGDVIAETLGKAGISVLHDRTLYDYPSYAGAYDRALEAIQRYLAQYPSIRFILDVHRDAIEDGQGNQYKVVSQVDGVGTAAQMSIVVGSDGSGLPHPDWMENLRLAVAVQENALERYPTLMRPVLLRNSRYNQHTAAGALLVEVGAAGNAPEEAALAGRLFAERLAEVLRGKTGSDGF
ncbi:stage II sporulation protein P [uncultured Dysosmobacter sp.]|uniref:stage II sporulation protein P n=1 Tax=uncultured Dysosmobacter sp. TaxID=2591384 RepID=UPI00263545E2|nr:stage II sporulation protein P [uncultured Dysosmobacter sp.]